VEIPEHLFEDCFPLSIRREVITYPRPVVDMEPIK